MKPETRATLCAVGLYETAADAVAREGVIALCAALRDLAAENEALRGRIRALKLVNYEFESEEDYLRDRISRAIAVLKGTA